MMPRAALMAAAFALALPVGEARADAFCEEMTALVALAQDGFADEARLENLTGAERCFGARDMAGANSFHCAWGFAFRDPAASDALASFDRALSSCFGAQPLAADEPDVNHPDSFDQRSYDVEGARVTLSMKDKGAARKTYLFIGLRRDTAQ